MVAFFLRHPVESLRMQDGERQNDGYQYNDINPIAQKKWITKSLAGVPDVVQALLTTAKSYFHVLYSTL